MQTTLAAGRSLATFLKKSEAAEYRTLVKSDVICRSLPIVAGSFPLWQTKTSAAIVNCITPSLSLLGVSRWLWPVYRLFTSLATLCTRTATLGGAFTSSTFLNGLKLMQNIPSWGCVGTGTVCSFPILSISHTLRLLLTFILLHCPGRTQACDCPH